MGTKKSTFDWFNYVIRSVYVGRLVFGYGFYKSGNLCHSVWSWSWYFLKFGLAFLSLCKK